MSSSKRLLGNFTVVWYWTEGQIQSNEAQESEARYDEVIDYPFLFGFLLFTITCMSVNYFSVFVS